MEIETKLKVDSLQPVRDRLHHIGAKLVSHQQQTDLYFDDIKKNLTLEDKCLRIRMVSSRQGDKTLLTFKGPKQKNNLKERQEIEFEISQMSQAEALMSALNFRKAITVTKSRELWKYRHCWVALDTVSGLGHFVEIEGPDSQTIHLVQAELTLGDVPHIQESYACLLAGNTNPISIPKTET